MAIEAGKLISGIREAEDSGIRWTNPFTGELEVWYSSEMAVSSQLRAAANRIKELEEQIREIKSFLVL